MSQNTISYEVNKDVCEAFFECFAEATTTTTTETKVKVGKQGTISLLLCKGYINRLDGKSYQLVLNYIFCDKCIWDGFPDEVIPFKTEDTKSDTNKIINCWTLFDDPELIQKHIPQGYNQRINHSTNGGQQQPTEYLVKYLNTMSPAITKILSLVQKTYDIVQSSSVKQMEDEKNSD
jgi:hypothetical protein